MFLLYRFSCFQDSVPLSMRGINRIPGTQPLLEILPPPGPGGPRAAEFLAAENAARCEPPLAEQACTCH